MYNKLVKLTLRYFIKCNIVKIKIKSSIQIIGGKYRDVMISDKYINTKKIKLIFSSNIIGLTLVAVNLTNLPSKLYSHNLKKLILPGLGIINLPSTFDLPNLEYLDLSMNKLKHIDYRFNLLKNLKTLILFHNIIQTFSADLPKLQNIDLDLNNFNILPYELFNNTIINVSLSYNNISSISNNLNCHALETLQLDNNNLSSITGDFNMPNIKELYLSNNKLKTINNVIYAPNLKILKLDKSLTYLVWNYKKKCYVPKIPINIWSQLAGNRRFPATLPLPPAFI